MLIPVYPGRPPVVRTEGGYVYVSVHDQAHLQERAVRRLALADAHPDRGGARSVFHTRRAAYDQWLARERAWYAALGLDVPRPGDAHEQPAPLRPVRSCSGCGRRITARNRSGRCRRCGMTAARDRRHEPGMLLNYRPLKEAPPEARAKIALITRRRAERPSGTRRGDRGQDPARVAATVARRRESPNLNEVRRSGSEP